MIIKRMQEVGKNYLGSQYAKQSNLRFSSPPRERQFPV